MVALERVQEIRRPLAQLEAEVVRRVVADPSALPPGAVEAVRYVLSFARLMQIRSRDGRDVDATELLARHRAWVHEVVSARLAVGEIPMRGLVRALPELTAATVALRARLLEQLPLDRESLEAEVCQRQLVVVCGGGGGSGYGYAGAFALLHRSRLQPELLAGTSIGSLACLFRARRRAYDSLPMIEAARRLSWNAVFKVFNMSNRYGVPATLRLHLRRALGPLMLTAEGQPMTFMDLEIPLLIVATGITVDGLKHDLSYYEHFLDDVVRPGSVLRASRIKRMQQYASLLSEFLASPGALREVVFGQDPMTLTADVLDAAGFSSAVPGLIHYDVLRDDPRMKALLDGLYAEYGITRLGEGGLVDNVPTRPALEEVMCGRVAGGRRNPVILALDCFPPRPRSLIWYPIQQIAAMNVRHSIPYADLYFTLDRVLSPALVVPTVEQLTQAMAWTTEELRPQVPFLQALCAPHGVLESPASGPEAGAVVSGGPRVG